MAMPDATLATLVGARLCHDVISPVGAIGNGLELLRLTDDPAEELALITASLTDAEARLRFFRIAFGSAAAGQDIPDGEVVQVLTALGHSRRATLDWQASGLLPRSEVRMALLALLCLEAAMPWGGTITVTRTGAGWQVSGTSDRFRIEPSSWAALEDDSTALTPAQVEFALLPALVAQAGRALRHAQSESRITLQF